MRELNFHNSTYEQWTLLAQKLGCLGAPNKIKPDAVPLTGEHYEKLKLLQLEEEYSMHRSLIMTAVLPRLYAQPTLLDGASDLQHQLRYFAACCGGYVPLKSLNPAELASFASRAQEKQLQQVLELLGSQPQELLQMTSPRSSISSQGLMQSQWLGGTPSLQSAPDSKEAMKKLVSRLMPF